MIQPSFLHKQAGQQLQQAATGPKKLALFHTAVALGCSLLATLLSYLFNRLIADTGGLSGMAPRSVLSTAQTTLDFAVMVLLPFWEIGFLSATLRWAKEETAAAADLLDGFRRWKPVLGFYLLRGVFFVALIFAVSNISTVIFMLTPFASPLMTDLEALLQQGTPEALESALNETLSLSFMQKSIPLLIIFGVLFALVAIPLFYRLRFSALAVMDGLPGGKALLHSLRVTKKNCLQILKLDLSFWWYYLLLGLCLAISYADVLLPVLGVTLPISADSSSLLFYTLGIGCQCLLLWQFRSRVLTAYALLYGNLSSPQTEPVSE